jgi:hypothetical protein
MRFNAKNKNSFSVWATLKICDYFLKNYSQIDQKQADY